MDRRVGTRGARQILVSGVIKRHLEFILFGATESLEGSQQEATGCDFLKVPLTSTRRQTASSSLPSAGKDAVWCRESRLRIAMDPAWVKCSEPKRAL